MRPLGSSELTHPASTLPTKAMTSTLPPPCAGPTVVSGLLLHVPGAAPWQGRWTLPSGLSGASDRTTRRSAPKYGAKGGKRDGTTSCFPSLLPMDHPTLLIGQGRTRCWLFHGSGDVLLMIRVYTSCLEVDLLDVHRWRSIDA